MTNIISLILAAGIGSRMNSSIPKVLHRVCGRPMLFYPLESVKDIGVDRTVIVVGHGSKSVREYFNKERDLTFVKQEEQLGTAHAVLTAKKEIAHFSGHILILSGDVPLLESKTLRAFIKFHLESKADLSLLTTLVTNPSGYGRIVRNGDDGIIDVVEDKDASDEERTISEINTGIYLVDSATLFNVLERVDDVNAQGEYYLTDIVRYLVRDEKKVAGFTHGDSFELAGVNNRVELAEANRLMRNRINRSLMLNGVTLIDPGSTFIDYGVDIGKDTVVYPGCMMLNNTVIESGCIVEENCRIDGSSVGTGSVIRSHSVVESSQIGKLVSIGPFARLRPGNKLGQGARIGNFVEVKNSDIGSGVKAGHLSYIGDANIGKDVNIGAGTITCNYDGTEKHRTIVEDNAFIGSDSQLVAPVTIGKGAYVGAGSTVTKDVPPDALAIGRAEQKVIRGWAGTRKKKGI